MAAVPVTMVGIASYDDGTSRNVTFIGMASLTGLGVGGGPMPPVGIWPSPGHPEHPIVLPPGKPDVPPPSVWPGPGVPPEGTAPLPEHPIVLPPPGNPIPPGTLITWTPVWTPDRGWFVVGVPNVPHPAPSA